MLDTEGVAFWEFENIFIGYLKNKMNVDIIISFISFILSIVLLKKGIKFPYDNDYYSWSMKEHFFVMAICLFVISIMFLLGKVHLNDFIK